MKRIAAFAFAAMSLALAACQDDGRLGSARAYAPIPDDTLALMHAKGMTKSSPVLIRTFKKEAELEVWKKDNTGRYAKLKTYPICRWSGQLGPKTHEGDRQAPEGFYPITPAQMNPNSHYYLSFDTGYPNAYDRANGHTGSFLMVHGTCSSRGCYAMTDKQIREIYAIMREAFSGGQREIQMQALPFHMTPKNFAKYRRDPNMPFWKNLKQGVDHFEVTRLEPKVGVCGRHYVFDVESANGGRLSPAAPCPTLKMDRALAMAVADKEKADDAKVAELVRAGTPAVRLVYQDGGQNPVFREMAYADASENSALVTATERPDTSSELGMVSRPEALMQGPREVALDGNGKPMPTAEPKPAVIAAKAQAPAAPAATSQAPAAPAQVAQAAAPAKPSFFSRVLSFNGLLPLSKPTPAGDTSATGGGLQPVNVPLPPRRQAGIARKPASANDRRAALPALLDSGNAPLPANLMSYSSVR